MKAEEIRTLSTSEIETELSDAREELMRLRFQMAVGGQTDTSRQKYVRRNIARLLTILRERKLMAVEEGEE